MSQKKPMVLVILDGWGYRQDDADNAVNNAKTPTMDALWQAGPKTLISTSGMAVGLPEGQMGNSEVGHTNIGAGRIVYQDFTRISKAIADGDFAENDVLKSAMVQAIEAGKAVHLMGLLSPGGVHSHEDHLEAAARMAAKLGATEIYLHCFLDGRDTPPKSAEASLKKFDALFAELGVGKIASLVGRYFAMDRDTNWDRVEKAYDVVALGAGEFSTENAIAGLKAAYDRGETDEFVRPTTIKKTDEQTSSIQEGDAVIFMNFRADRAREMTRCFLPDFKEFDRKAAPKTHFVMLTEYAADIDFPVAYPPENLSNTFGEWLQEQGKTQLRISETEKYAHVTFFFNGGVETEFNGEDRILIPSPKVATYDLQPEMNSAALTKNLTEAIRSGKYDAIICNYPNGDMVGHTGVYEAAVKACEAVDSCLAEVVQAIKDADGQLLITADHGNAEMMVDPTTGGIHTAHTTLPVPLIYVGNKEISLAEGGKLCDLAPTMLSLMGLTIPTEMSGKALA